MEAVCIGLLTWDGVRGHLRHPLPPLGTLFSPARGLHLWGGVDSVMGRNGQRCVLTDTVLGAVASVPGGREQDVAGGAGEGLLGPERSVGGAWQ